MTGKLTISVKKDMKKTVKDRNWIKFLLLGFYMLQYHCAEAQLVAAPLTVTPQTSVINSTSEISIELSKISFIVYWQIDSKDVVQCTYGSGDPTVFVTMLNTSYTPRLNSTYEMTTFIKLTLTFDPLLASDNNSVVTIISLPSFNELGSGALHVLPDCLPLNASGVEPTASGCEYGKTCNFKCLSGRIGNATADCQANGTYTVVTNNCREVICNTNDADLPENCVIVPNYEVLFGEEVKITCARGLGSLICDDQELLQHQSLFLATTSTQSLHDSFVVGATAPVSVKVTGRNFTLEWKLNALTAAVCQVQDQNNVTCSTYGEYENRITVSFDYDGEQFTFTLELKSISMNDNNTNVDIVGKVPFVGEYAMQQSVGVLSECKSLISDSIASVPKSNCPFNASCTFGCQGKIDGSAIAICQGNGIYLVVRNNCWPALFTGDWAAIVVCLGLFLCVSGAVGGYCIRKKGQKKNDKQTTLETLDNKSQ